MDAAAKIQNKPVLDPKYGRDGVLGMTISGIGPSIAAIFTNPAEVVKTRLQMQNELKPSSTGKVYSGFWNCLLQTYRAEGILGVQRGLSLAMFREGSKCFFRLGLYDPIVFRIHPVHDKSGSDKVVPFWKRLFAGGMSGMISSIICNPLDVVKVRFQASGGLTTSHHGKLTSVRSTVYSVYQEGGIKQFFVGTHINCTRSIVFTSMLMALDSRTNELLHQHLSMPDSPARNAFSSFLASAVG